MATKQLLIDPVTAARIRHELQAARDGLITDQTLALGRAIDLLLTVLEAAR